MKEIYKMLDVGLRFLIEKLDWITVGTGENPGFNASTMHQKNSNYRPFRQHQ
jgi:hypothetical protein